jgi:hypothetical protein
MFFIQKCIKIFFLKKIIFDISALKWFKNIKKINLKLKKIKKINLFLKYFKTEKQIRYLSLGFTRRPYIEVYVNEFFFLMYEWSKKKIATMWEFSRKRMSTTFTEPFSRTPLISEGIKLKKSNCCSPLYRFGLPKRSLLCIDYGPSLAFSFKPFSSK